MNDSSKPVQHTLAALPIHPGDKFCDFLILCKPGGFAVHRVIVCSHSPVIDAAWRSPFIEQLKATFEIQGFPLDVVEAAIDFMYTSDYAYKDASGGDQPMVDNQERSKNKKRRRRKRKVEPNIESKVDTPDVNEESCNSNEEHELLFHASVNCLADYLNMPPLRQLAIQKIKWLTEQSWEIVKPMFLEFLDLVCNSAGDKNLHLLAVKITAQHLDDLVEPNIFEASQLPPSFFAMVLRESASVVQGLKSDVMWAMAGKRRFQERLQQVDDLVAYSQKRRKCLGCSQRLSSLGYKDRTPILKCGHCSREHLTPKDATPSTTATEVVPTLADDN